ncbi:MAG: hypothetical protein QM632_05225 [Micrococcaceae bacterium]
MRPRDLQIVALALIVLACLVAVTISFRVGGFLLAVLMVYLLVVRWARYPQGHTFAAKDKVTDSVILIFLTIVIVTLSLIAPT